jgi:hypothetical protein
MPGKTFEIHESLGAAVTRFDNGSAGAGTTTPELRNGFYQKQTVSAATRTVAAPVLDGVALAASDPRVPVGTLLFVEISNTSGGATVITWNAAFKGAPTAPATANRRVHMFVWDGSNWVLMNNAADVAN